MSSPIIWIFIPAFSSGILFLLRRWHRTTVLSGALIALTLAGLAIVLPIDQQIRLGPLSFHIENNLEILGRLFILHDYSRYLLAISYGLIAFWFTGSYLANAGREIVPFGLFFNSLLIAAFSVEPFLYGPIMIEIAIIVSIPILIKSATVLPANNIPEANSDDRQLIQPIGGLIRGALRFLIFQTMGMPFLLVTGWVLTGVETTPGEDTIVLAASLAGFGFLLLLAIFPFHTWVLILMEKSQPYVVTFIFVLFFWWVSLYALRFIDQYLWLSQSGIFPILRITGLIVIFIAGASVIFEQNLARILGYAILIETGYVFVAFSLNNGLVLIFQMLLPRALSFGTWALALGFLKSRTHNLDFKRIRGLMRVMPVTGIALILAQMSIAGLPLLAAFPIRYTLWNQLAAESIWVSLISMSGLIGLVLTGLRSLAVFMASESVPAGDMIESGPTSFLLGIVVIVMVLVGLFPQLFLPVMTPGLQAFVNLASTP